MSIYGVILAGGVGTRLWPRSRQTQPKQFADILGRGRTMIQATGDRLEGLIPPDRVLIVTGRQYADLCAAQMPQARVILEPSGRNTAPAIGLACIHLLHHDPNARLVILPADHVIADAAAFQQALQHALWAAQEGYIVTLGIEPTFPHTGYGYIKRGAAIAHAAGDPVAVFTVEQFLEKPSRTVAEAFLAEGGYYWNGGIFVARADAMLAELERQMPPLYAGLQAIASALRDTPQTADTVLQTVWPLLPATSIDHGVMEHAQAVATVPLNAGWNDVGSWDALESILDQDESRNYIAKGPLLAIDSGDNIVYADKQVVALIGVHDLVVVDTGDTLLIGHKQQMQKVKDVVERLRALGRSDLL